MPITEKQRESMTKHLGCSEIAAAVNASKWANAADIYYRKVDGVFNEAGAAAEMGNALEESVLTWAERELDLDGKFKRNQRRIKNKWLRATHDAIVKDRPIGIQAKTAGILSGNVDQSWGEPWTDEIPQEIILQVQGEMYVSDLDRVFVPALLAGRGFVMYVVDRSEPLIERLIGKAKRFWVDNVLAKVPPADVAPDIEILKRLHREPGSVVDLGAQGIELVAAYEQARDLRLEYEKAEKASKAALTAALGTAEGGVLPGGRMVTYLRQRGAPIIDREALKADGLIEKYSRENEFPVLRIKKGESHDTGNEQ